MTQLLDFLVENEPGFRRARLPALYSDFQSQRTLNPDGYEANVSAWRRALALIARSGLVPSRRTATPNRLILDCDEQLLRALETKQYGRPLALGAVVREALAARDLMPLADFLAAKESIYRRPWSVWGLASWALRQAGVTDLLPRSDRLPTGQFVVLANVEDAARRFGERTLGAADASLLSRFDRTFSRAHFHRAFAAHLVPDATLSEADVDVLLRFLARDKGVLLYDGKTVRIRAASSSSSLSSSQAEDAAALTNEDATVAQLKELQAYLAHQIAVLDARVAELARAAREAATTNRAAALAALRAKKTAEATLTARHASLAQIEDVAARIEQAGDSVALVGAMSASAAALQTLNARTGGAERVEAVVERLRAQVDAADEVASILAEGAGGAAAVVDEAEVDDELEVLEREEREKRERARAAAQERERTAQREKEERLAEETRRRLEAIEQVPAATEQQGEKPAEERSVEQAAEGISRMSLQESAQ